MNNAIESGIAKLKASFLPHINCSPSPTFPQISMTCRQGVSCFSSLTVLAAISPVLRAALPPCCHHLSTSLLLPQCDEAVMALLVNFVQGGKVVASLGKCSKVMEMLKMLGVQTKDISLEKHNDEYCEVEELNKAMKAEGTKNAVVDLDQEDVLNILELDEILIVHEMPSSMVRKSEQISFVKVKEERNEVMTDQSSAQLIDILKEEKEKLEKEIKFMRVLGPTEEKLRVSQEKFNSMLMEKIASQTVLNTWKKRNQQLNFVIASYKSPAEETARLKEALEKLSKILMNVRTEKNQLEATVSQYCEDIDVGRIRDEQNTADNKNLNLDLAKARKEVEESNAHRKDSVIKCHLNTISQIKTSNVRLKKNIQIITKEIKRIENVKDVEVAKLIDLNSQLVKKFEAAEKNSADHSEKIKKIEKDKGKVTEEMVQLRSYMKEKEAMIQKLRLAAKEIHDVAVKRMADFFKVKRKVEDVEEEGNKLKISLAKKDTSLFKLRQEVKYLREKAEATDKDLGNLTKERRKIKELSTQISSTPFSSRSLSDVPGPRLPPPVFIFASPLALSDEINQDGQKCKRRLLEKEQLFEESGSARKKMKFSSWTKWSWRQHVTVQETPISCKCSNKSVDGGTVHSKLCSQESIVWPILNKN